jgi:hypothetical protein
MIIPGIMLGFILVTAFADCVNRIWFSDKFFACFKAANDSLMTACLLAVKIKI